MKRTVITGCLVWFQLWSCETYAAKPTAILVGEVTKVIDGDTIRIGRTVKVRLYGMDTPEREWKGHWPKQPGSDEATDALSVMVAGKQVVAVVRDVGRWNRPVADLYAEGVWINLQLVKQGHAHWSRKYAPKSKELEAAEQEARRQKLGLWSQLNPVRPSEWRKGRRE